MNNNFIHNEIGRACTTWQDNHRRNGTKVTVLMGLFLCFFCTLSYGQGITLSYKEVPLKTVINALSKQSNMNFVYDETHLKNALPVTINIKNGKLTNVLQTIFKDQPLIYQVTNDGIIYLKPKPISNTERRKMQLRGRVTDSLGEPLAGVTIMVSGTTNGTSTDQNGRYQLNNIEPGVTITVSLIGYEPAVLTVNGEQADVTLFTKANTLDGITVAPLNTGYQNLPKERATGSFTQIDGELLQRNPTTSITDRLNGIANGLILNTGSRGYNTPTISIRGRSTILGNANPLIVVDNFPYGGDLSSINPNDVESITLLKDAAAASIWGTQAGNGVIVITTKSGRFNQKTAINFSTNLTIGQKPRLLTQRQMSSAEFIEVETRMFEVGRYNTTINNGYAALSPAVEILLMHRNNQISLDRRNAMLDSLSQYDVRNDQLKYLYQVPINQQYNLNLSGGTNTQKYYLSAGYDKNQLTEVGNSFERFSLNGQNTYNLLNNKLQLINSIQFTHSLNTTKATGAITQGYKWPYLKLADEAGNALPVANDLRFSYIEAQNGKGLLDWYYRPLDELAPSNFNKGLNFRLQNSLSYQIIPQLSLKAYHAWQKGVTNTDNFYYANSYYTRNLINSITTINSSTGVVTRPIAEGDILNKNQSILTGQYGRLQAVYEGTFAGKHSINAIAGAEISEFRTDNSAYTLYGYNPQTGASANAAINYTQSYPRYYGGNTTVPNGISNNGLVDHNISYYANAAYTYNNRYTLSASARKDQSNIFGVKANQKGVPLWSVGGLWHIGREAFYNISWLPALALRTTYGYNGNVDKSTSAYFTTQLIGFANAFGLPQFQVNNPPNPSLRWEKVSNLNFGLEFGTAGNKINGSIEYYTKNGKDLIGLSPIAPQTGLTSYRGNNADLLTRGIDLRLNSQNLTGTNFQWQTTFLFSYVKDKVTDYKAKPGSNNDIVGNNANLTPLVGYPFNSWFAYRWASLDATGSPQSYLNGAVSSDYTAIVNSTDRAELVYMGSRVPTFFGSLLNTFTYKSWQLSCLISYKTGYVFKDGYSLGNSNLYATSNISYTISADYGKRWQQPGDELKTNVPALIYPTNTNRDNVYTNSEILVYNASHIRLQDVRLSYNAGKKILNVLPLKQLNLFMYASNLGILWRANKAGFDPESPSIQQTRNITFGLSTQF